MPDNDDLKRIIKMLQDQDKRISNIEKLLTASSNQQSITTSQPIPVKKSNPKSVLGIIKKLQFVFVIGIIVSISIHYQFALGTDQPQSLLVTSASDFITVEKGNGDGTFSGGAHIPTGIGPDSLVVGNFTGHGDWDVAVSNKNSNDITVLQGLGNGSFIALPTITGQNIPISIVKGDFNRDGKLDLAVSNQGCNCVSILLGNGNGTFTAKPSITGLPSPRQLVSGDFNGGTTPDLAVVTHGKVDAVSILISRGDGTFYRAHQYVLAFRPFAIAKGDFNGDHKQDLVVSAEYRLGGYGIQVLLNNGNGSFKVLPPLFGTGEDGFQSYSLITGDFNGDGKLDLAVVNILGHIYILLGNGDGTFTPLNPIISGSIDGFMARGDFNGDGKKDIAITNDLRSDSSLKILLGNGNGTFTTKTSIIDDVGDSPSAIAVITFTS